MKRQNVLNKKKRKKGFTLIELIIVMAIMAILALIAVPKFVGFKEEANKKHDVTSARTIANAASSKFAINNASYTKVELDGTGNNANAANIEALLETRPTGKTKKYVDENFKVTVDSNGEVTVYLNDGTDDREVYPNPYSDFK